MLQYSFAWPTIDLFFFFETRPTIDLSNNRHMLFLDKQKNEEYF